MSISLENLDSLSGSVFKKIAISAADSIIIINEDQNIVFVNTSAEELFGSTEHELLGEPVETLIPHRYRAQHAAAAGEFHNKSGQARYMGDQRSHIVGLRSDGTEVLLGATILTLKDENSNVMVAIMRDITETVNFQDELSRFANTDPLTGILNRRAFYASAETEQDRPKQRETKFSVLLIDFDRFKAINDIHGHTTGDDVLRTVSDMIRSSLREFDIFARWGGEEFIVLLPQTNLDTSQKIAEELRTSIANTTVRAADGTPLCITVSIGVCDNANPTDDLDTVIKWADGALYEAKSRGRNRVMVARGPDVSAVG